MGTSRQFTPEDSTMKTIFALTLFALALALPAQKAFDVYQTADRPRALAPDRRPVP